MVLQEKEGGDGVEFSSYVPVVRKLNLLFRGLEEQEGFLSRDGMATDGGEGGKNRQGKGESTIHRVTSILLEDLNNYSEAMIPISPANTLNIKLFPTYPPPPPLRSYHVPLATVRLAPPIVDENWDLTLQRVLPWIDGVNSVKQIALRADADEKLVRKAIRHLLYYGCVVLLDVFSFGAGYACRSGVRAIVEYEEMREECKRYVTLDPEELASDIGVATNSIHYPIPTTQDPPVTTTQNDQPITATQLAELYLSLKQGQSLKSWCMHHAELVSKIDIRRFITFGVLKGILYRVHKYAFLAPAAVSKEKKKKEKQKLTRANLDHTADRAGRTDADDETERGEVEEEIRKDDDNEEADLVKYLDGTHCFDEICTDLMISEKELMGRLKALGDVQIICR